LFGIDSQKIYYSVQEGSSGEAAYAVAKTANDASGTLLRDVVPMGAFSGILGDYMLYQTHANRFKSVCVTSSCASSANSISNTGAFAVWGYPQSYFAIYDTSLYPVTITWLTANLSEAGKYTEDVTDSSYGYNTPFYQYEDLVFFIRTLNSSGVLLSASAASTSGTVHASNLGLQTTIVDINTQSVLLWDAPYISTTSTLLRVSRSGSSSAQIVTAMNPAPEHGTATEDASWVYWFDGGGNIKRCTASSSSGCVESSTATIGTGQHAGASLYQDSTALYWADPAQAKIMRLAK
jgi:hypothetical protein